MTQRGENSQASDRPGSCRALWAALGLAVVGFAIAGPAAAAGGAAALEGKWWGTVGSPRERVEVGLELRRDESGVWSGFLTQPISNYFGVELPPPVTVEGNQVTVANLALSLTLDANDVLSGTYPGPNSAASLRRVAAIPADPGIPDLPQGPGPKWQIRLHGQIFAGPVVADGVAFVGTSGGVFQAVDAGTGALRWTFSAGRPIFGQALVTADAVFFVCDNGYLFKLGRQDGKEIWRYDLGDARVGRVLPHPAVFDWSWQAPEPVIADGVVYVGAADGGFHAVDSASGGRRWRFATGGRIATGALVVGGRVYVGSADHFVYALDREKGEAIWKFDTGAEVDGAPRLVDGRVVVGNRGAGVFAVNAETGDRAWMTYFWGSWVESTATVDGGTLYIGSSDLRRVSAIDPADGRVLWRSDVYGWTWGTPLVVGDRLYAGAAGGSPYFVRHAAGFLALDKASGKVLWRWPLPDVPGAHQWGIAGSPALAGDTVVVTTIEGGMMGFPVG